MKAKIFSCALLMSLLPLAVQAQTGQVTGVVTSTAGQPLAGVQVGVVGSQLRTVTAADGRYSLANVPIGPRAIQASSIGYASSEQVVNVSAGSAVTANFQLEDRAIALKEIVVVGYGTQRREQVTGAVASVTSDDFVAGPARDAAALIAGKVAGLQISQTSGNPRGESQIRLRGTTTLNSSSSPLVMIDGVPGELETVPAQDIESISVLKDGSAAAIYGSRATNGVILITTKKHAGGAPTLRYDGYLSQSKLYRTPDFLTAADFRRLAAEGRPFTDLGNNTNWQDVVLREPFSQRHNLSISGGALNTNYTAALDFDNAEGIFNRSDNQELTARANIRHSMFNGKLEAEGTFLNRTETAYAGTGFNGIWRQALIRNPTDKVKTDDGKWQETAGYMYTNPAQSIAESNGEVEERVQRLHARFTLRPIQQLSISLLAGSTRSSTLVGSATTFLHPSNTQSASGGTASRSLDSGRDRIAELTGTFAESFRNHNITLLGGYGYQDEMDEGFNASNSRFTTDQFDWNALQSGTGVRDGVTGPPSSSKSDSKLINMFGRLNYDYANKYLLMVSVNREGSSKFGAGNKWGIFPGVSAGWRISEESFMNRFSFIDDLRLRAGWGITGIAPGGSYQSLNTYSYTTDRMLYNGTWVQGYRPTRNANPNLKWEEKTELNFGVNFALFNSKLNGVIDVYERETNDMLYGASVPVPPYQFGSITANVAKMKNNGVEVELGYDIVNRPGFRWTTNANWSKNTNKLVSLSDEVFQAADCFNTGGTGEPIQQSTHRTCVGDPVGNFFGWESVDIADDGKWLVRAQGDSLTSAFRAGDRRVLGNGIPKQNFGWNNEIQVRNFDLSVNMRGAADFQILNFMRMYYENPTVTQYNMLKSAFHKVYGKRELANSLVYVSYYVEDGDYIKLDNATLGYTVPRGSLGRLSSALSGVRFYVSGRNLATFTGYKGLDPEVDTSGLTPGTDNRDTYPTIRTFTFGATFTF